jgi:predicted TIM-barrel fold metal-dependent hydrolase
MPISFGDVPVFDFHTHPVEKKPVSSLINRWLDVHSSVLQVDEDSGRKVRAIFERQYANLPYFQSLIRYISKKYDVAPTLESVDKVLTDQNDRGVMEHVRKVLQSENIEKIIIDISGLNHPPSPNPKLDQYPAGRYLFTMGTEPLLQPKAGQMDLEEAVSDVDLVLSTALRNGCVGFKTWMAYYRSLHIEEVSEEEVRNALKILKDTKVEINHRWGVELPVGATDETRKAIKQYQDYMWVHICEYASIKNVPVLIHTGGAMSPSIDMRNANPELLYSLFYNPRVRKAQTRIVMLHCGYPFHNVAAAIVSQFPNAFIDLSFFTGLRGVTEEVLRTFVELAPHDKILYGSDASTVPERLGWCACNIRESLSYVLSDFKERYGWPSETVSEIASKILNQNTKEVLRPSN